MKESGTSTSRRKVKAAALQSSKIVKNAQLKVYPGFPHGMCQTTKDQINADLLAFIKS
jgi:non-heme chloroperoxidase